MAGGADEKWTSLGGRSRRHFQLVNGERVIDRIIRQLRERGVTAISIVAPDLPGYAIVGTTRIAPGDTSWGHEATNGQAGWSTTDRTLQVYGDVILTDAAMDTIVGYDRRTFQMFGRHGPGGISPWGELFALSFWPEHQRVWVAALQLSFRLKQRGVIRRAGSWEAYRIMGGAIGRQVRVHRLYPALFTDIDDASDDFDDPTEFERLRALHEAA